MAFTRRSALLGASAILPVLALAACGSKTSGALLDPQVLADAQGIVAANQLLIAGIMAAAPTAISPDTANVISQAEGAAIAVLGGLTTSTPAAAGATALQQVEAQIKTVLTAIAPVFAAVPSLAKFVPAYDAAVALLPLIEAWINSVVTVVTPPKAALGTPMKAIGKTYTPAQARDILGVEVVK